MLLKNLPALLLLLVLAGCNRADPDELARQTTIAGTQVTAVDWPLPVSGVAAQPDLVLAPDGRVLLSWISAEGSGLHVLRFAAFDGDAWTTPREIARGSDWFVNWADTPHLAVTADGALWAHWLRKSADATYAYDVVLSRSSDGGQTWAAGSVVHDDGTPTEHGFVSLWPQSQGALGLAWLDGRNTLGGAQGGHEGHDAHGSAGAMSLRAGRVDASLRKSVDTEIDARTCDCCQTSAAITERGPLLVYRGRDADEVRDILATRLEDGAWTRPRKVHDDQWTMPACPVNGPDVAARGTQAWVAWYTATGDLPQLRIARSANAGHEFDPPVQVDQGEAVQGRAGVAADGVSVWVSWLREENGVQSLWLARYAPDLSRELQRVQVAALQGRGRATGFPQLVAGAGGVLIAWTDVVDGKPQLRGARITPQPM